MTVTTEWASEHGCEVRLDEETGELEVRVELGEEPGQLVCTARACPVGPGRWLSVPNKDGIVHNIGAYVAQLEGGLLVMAVRDVEVNPFVDEDALVREWVCYPVMYSAAGEGGRPGLWGGTQGGAPAGMTRPGGQQ